MKKWLIPLVIVLLLIIWGMRANNNVVNLEETVTEAWANVESSYQRRNDLIGNLVKTVQGAADFEKTTLTQVIEARAKATSTTIDASKYSSGIEVLGVGDLLTNIARCCNPIPGDKILGFITRGRGVTIHRNKCLNIVNEDELENDKNISLQLPNLTLPFHQLLLLDCVECDYKHRLHQYF